MSIQEALKTNYSFYPAIVEDYVSDKIILTIIIDCFYNLELVRQAIDSVLVQSYQNVELMLIDNGSNNDVKKYLLEIYGRKNTALIKFRENQFSWKDTSKGVAVCWNAGLIHSRGDIVAHLAYDDMISPDYACRMSKLFMENDSCVTAAPLPVSIDINGNVNKKLSDGYKEKNKRDKYSSGKEIALNILQSNTKRIFSAPGEILVIKKELLIKYGGFDRLNDLTQVIKFAIHGESGFDPKAKLFWRHHSGQVNKQGSARYLIWCSEFSETIKDIGIVDMWTRIFSQKDVNILKKFIKIYHRSLATNAISAQLRKKNINGLGAVFVKILLECPLNLLYSIFYLNFEIVRMISEKVNFTKKNT
mgnify:FL=1|jgi:glycosyltransferase involved in cell wall biosynthesis